MICKGVLADYILVRPVLGLNGLKKARTHQ